MELQAPTPSADLLVQKLRNDPNRLANLKASADPIKEVENLAKEAVQEADVQTKQYQAAYLNDRKVYRAAVYVLGALTIIAAIGAILLKLQGAEIPESVVALGSTSVGALVGLFAKSPTGS